jgi:DNA-binding winged helix-turn-helix (wHTH) protein
MRYDFGDCEFDAERCELRCAGQPVQVEPKVFKVLAHLITHRHRVVPKDELLEHFWPGTFISESALTQCLTKVRKAVQDDNVSQRIIKTVRALHAPWGFNGLLPPMPLPCRTYTT